MFIPVSLASVEVTEKLCLAGYELGFKEEPIKQPITFIVKFKVNVLFTVFTFADFGIGWAIIWHLFDN